ncbi:hypothetical protein PXK30_12705 [Phaeobacter gallaeciensis]|uniref:Uncharacterized protein n=2 Tax=Phaeobacter gallaeciensis TaxID=60890 RepID=A0ABD4X8W9_9RHOB|nr:MULTISPECIES: hypothetical protein [Phaeobacter]MDF1773546.1 hypothetical protein [Pseudophaeobacter sp. bin_em_oilr2.035]MEC9310160.1 hypothetical protein [Pseudomonadota bacterium]MDE4059707.1 hypothetical protein [Phaeobacter gallaeciensis]MDE4098299.1 hypothetical protein [Phaeobacter gallaeciensis]MDE4107109.1 hypothetical protein [Phaeobacter gallaeciensis]
MSTRMEDLLARMRELQDELEDEIADKRAAFQYKLENGRIVWEEEARRRHRALRVRWLRFLAYTRPMVLITAPFIYALIVPFVLLDLFVLVYQAACFPVYGIPKVPRRDFIRMDRHHLAYLNGVQKLNCIYCGYCNGVIAWVREVASRTEAYWCPIKHAARVAGAHARYAEFSEFGDGEGFEAGLARSRRKVQEKDGPDEADGG